MEGLVVTDPVPAVEEPEITSDATTAPAPAEPPASDGSGGGDSSEASCPRSLWSLTHEQQVHNLKENWKRAFDWTQGRRGFGKDLEVDPWFARVAAKLRVDPCLDSSRLEIDQSPLARFLPGATMNSLDLAILTGDLKMVQKILETRSDRENIIRGPLEDIKRVRENLSKISTVSLHISLRLLDEEMLNRTCFLYTPLHLAIKGGYKDIVNVLLSESADVNAPDIMFQTPLDVACKNKDVAMLQQLLEKDSKEGKHPLHVAVRHGDVDFMKKLPSLNVNALDRYKRTPLHYLAASRQVLSRDYQRFRYRDTVQYLAEDKNKALDMKALDGYGLSAFYVAVLNCNTEVVIALLDFFKDQIRLNEECMEYYGPPIQIAFEGGDDFKDIERALMECEPVKSYMDKLYRDRQVYVDAANAILVGAALIASVTFASWLQPPLNYTTYYEEGHSSSIAPSTSDLNYVDVEHNIALRAFWVFNALSFYFAIGTVVCGARSVLPRSHLFIKKIVERLRTNLLVTSIFLACSVLFVIVAFAIAGTIVLTPLVKYQWCMIVPTIVGGTVCIISLDFLVKSMVENYFNRGDNRLRYAKEYIETRYIF